MKMSDPTPTRKRKTTAKPKPQDSGGKLCAKCPPGEPCTNCDHPVVNPEQSVVDPGPLLGSYVVTVIDEKRMLPIQDQEKLVEALGIDTDVWKLGYELKFEKQQWTFYLLLRHLQDASLNQRIVCGTY